jgi:hypothetical protein
VEFSVEPLPGTVPCEHPPRPIRAVRPGREADQQEPGVGISESGNRKSPIGFVPVGGALQGGRLEAVGTKPRASLARDHIASYL